MSTPHLFKKGAFSFLVLVLSFQMTAFAQADKTPATTKQRATNLLRKNLRFTGLTQADLQDYIITDAFEDKRSGDFIVYLQQGYLGIPVYNKIGVFVFRKDSLVGKTPNFISRLTVKIPKKAVTGGKPAATLSADDAVRKAADHLSIAIQPGKGRVKKKDLTWLPVDNGEAVKLSWNVRIATDDGNNDWQVRVDAQTGEVLQKSSLIVSERGRQGQADDEPGCEEGMSAGAGTSGGSTATGVNAVVGASRASAVTSSAYRVYLFPIQSANFGSRSLDTDPWQRAGAGNNATTLGWHFDNTNSYTYTRGNNVWAQQDLAGNNATTGFTDTSSTAIPVLTFDRTVDASASPAAYSNIRAGLDNLFYWNNIMHDISYQYGFDEAAGNFQTDNQGRGGLGNDYVNAFALDGAGINNSDFFTPADGENPRMRMYMWNYGVSSSLHINAPSAIVANYIAVESGLSFKNKLSATGPITNDIVLVNDPVGTHQGCSSFTNASSVAGKIALIDRGGGCSFLTKIKTAQSAGAVAVIIANNVAGDPLVMTGTDTTVTIPAVMISQSDGNTLKANTTGLNGVLSSSGQYIDGSFDNAVIAHEYTHGISNRLTGGPANADCLYNAEQMGEGWSDYMGLMVTTDWSTATVNDGAGKRTLGSYVMAQPATGAGIRRYPYSTDMSINPWKYDSLATGTQGEVHNIGEIWCATLWDMTWNIIQQEGIDPDIYHGTKGNNIALQLVIQGLKYQPCGPGFIDGRDAILKADSLLYNYAHKCAIWNAFARRGMGKSASQGSANSYTDQVTATDVPSGVGISQSIDKASPVHGDNVTYTVKASCNCTPLTGLTIVDSLSSNLSYVTSSGGSYSPAGTNTQPYVHFDGVGLAAGETKSFTIQASVTGSFTNPDTLINDGQDPSNYSWTKTTTSSALFASVSSRAHSGSHSWYAPDGANTSDFALMSGDMLLDTVSTLSFWHYFETDPTYDGGAVEISTDGGSHWQDLGPYMTQNGYNSNLLQASGTSDRQGFSGSSGGAFIQTVVSLSGFAGTLSRIRFRFTSDESVGVDGWYIDDILLRNEKGVVSVANAYNGSTLLSSQRSVSSLGAGALPVNFLLFEAKKQNASSWLHWKVNGALQVSKYMVERSGDGSTFTSIGEVPAGGLAGTSSSEYDYSFVDGHPLTGNNFYRVKEVDLDGQVTFSGIRLLQWSSSGLSVQVYPVPTYDHAIQLDIAADNDNAAIEAHLINTVGQVVGVYTVKKGSNRLILSNLPKGLYFLTIQMGDRPAEIRKVVIGG